MARHRINPTRRTVAVKTTLTRAIAAALLANSNEYSDALNPKSSCRTKDEPPM